MLSLQQYIIITICGVIIALYPYLTSHKRRAVNFLRSNKLKILSISLLGMIVLVISHKP